MILCYLVIYFCIDLCLCVVSDDFKSYKNYKIYEIEGNKNEINKIITYLQDAYVSVFFRMIFV